VGRDVIPTAAGDGLRVRALHEWFAGGSESHDPDWSPPLLPLIDLVRRGFVAGLVSRIVWIGGRVFPYPLTLARHEGMLPASVFVDPPSAAARLWAIDLALRCGAPTAVVADGQGFTLPHTRRLQLAASAGRGIALLARPSSESHTLSAATTRWRVESCPSHNSRVGWTLTLLRNKDHPSFTDDARASNMEWKDGEGLVAVPAVVERGAGAASAGSHPPVARGRGAHRFRA
jgi:protein ImuA